jgi:voltage-dependent potassium channel beta subunit
MKYRRLGLAGVKVSEVSLGGWLTFGATVDEPVVKEIVRAAVDEGVNFFDLADIYARGEAERAFGVALAEHRRSDLVISSKAYWPMSEGPNDRGLSRKHLHESVEGSLKRLGTDYLDIYFCHRYDEETTVEEVAMAMNDLVRQGKILYWGTSVWPSAKIAEAVFTSRRLGAHQPRVEQPRYNMIDRHIETEILPTASELGMGLVVWSPLAQGVLSGKYAEGVPEGSRAAKIDWVRKNIKEEDIATASRVAVVAAELGITQSQLALAWCLRLPEISSTITGATRPEQVRENAAASDVDLDEEVLERIEELLGNKPEPLVM